MGTCYLLHFSEKLAHAAHYIGYTDGGIDAILKRLECHRKGKGARLIEVISQVGISFRLVRIWDGYSRKDERLLKKRKNAPKLCPICRGMPIQLPKELL